MCYYTFINGIPPLAEACETSTSSFNHKLYLLFSELDCGFHTNTRQQLSGPYDNIQHKPAQYSPQMLLIQSCFVYSPFNTSQKPVSLNRAANVLSESLQKASEIILSYHKSPFLSASLRNNVTNICLLALCIYSSVHCVEVS